MTSTRWIRSGIHQSATRPFRAAPRPDWLIKLLYNAMPALKLLIKPRFNNGYGVAAPDDAIADDKGTVRRRNS